MTPGGKLMFQSDWMLGLYKSSSESGRKDIQDFTESLAAMAVEMLFGGGELGVGLTQGFKVKDRVIAESASASRFVGDQAVAAAGDHRKRTALPGQRCNADEMCAPVFPFLSAISCSNFRTRSASVACGPA